MSCTPTLPFNTRILVSHKNLWEQCPFCNAELTHKAGTENTKSCARCGYSVTRRRNRYRQKPWLQVTIGRRLPSCTSKIYCKRQTDHGRCRQKEFCQYQKQRNRLGAPEVKKVNAEKWLTAWAAASTWESSLSRGNTSRKEWMNGISTKQKPCTSSF